MEKLRKLIVEGNMVYEIDEECMLKKEMQNTQRPITVEQEESKEKKIN